ncbi:MAG: stage 0 sporulation family protein [Clostridiales bacterium]|jgi:cell fate regulator YaaT (PSP1 superfamily)|nr:stage 0 sporulation family protein [Clostridiales bacterium]
MIEVVGVRFKPVGRIYYFDPDGTVIDRGQHVIVETVRGVEYGMIEISNRFVKESEVVMPLKKIIRIAAEEDAVIHQANIDKQNDAFEICYKKIKEHKLDMKLIDAEFTFDQNKVIFYFTSDGRVDFRELVKDLAAIFRTRIELRQIGVRDEAKMVNGMGICGVTLCCATFLSEFQPVSIKMAKEQNLSLNPAKISGICGRLMCCLKYEEEAYIELNKLLPNVGDIVNTVNGNGEVLSVNVLRKLVKVAVRTKNKDDIAIDYYNAEEIKVMQRKRIKDESLSDAELAELKTLMDDK